MTEPLEFHTELPWAWQQYGLDDGPYIEIYGPGGESIAQTGVGSTQDKANFDFIVRACNSHHELVNTISDLAAIIEPSRLATLSHVKRVLAKAKGE